MLNPPIGDTGSASGDDDDFGVRDYLIASDQGRFVNVHARSMIMNRRNQHNQENRNTRSFTYQRQSYSPAAGHTLINAEDCDLNFIDETQSANEERKEPEN